MKNFGGIYSLLEQYNVVFLSGFYDLVSEY